MPCVRSRPLQEARMNRRPEATRYKTRQPKLDWRVHRERLRDDLDVVLVKSQVQAGGVTSPRDVAVLDVHGEYVGVRVRKRQSQDKKIIRSYCAARSSN